MNKLKQLIKSYNKRQKMTILLVLLLVAILAVVMAIITANAIIA